MKPRTVGVMAYWPYNSKRLHDAARRLAGQAVKNALARGELTRQPCERCAGYRPKRGPRRSVEAHHDDYAQPLSVRWLCRLHHQEVHRELLARVPTPEQFRDIRTRENHSILNTCQPAEPLVRAVTTDMLSILDSNGVTQNQLAKRLGVSRQHVNCYFHGGIRTLKALAAIAGAVGYDVAVSFTQRQAKTEAA